MPKTTKKVVNKNKNKGKLKKETKIEEENKKLRGYWTKLAKIQKSKGLSSTHATESQSEDLIFDGSPETTPRNMTSLEQPSLHSISSCRESLPSNHSNPSNMKVKLLEQPKLNIDVEGFNKSPG